MPQGMYSVKQPTRTIDLIASLENGKTSQREAKALTALKSEMLVLFKHNPGSLYWKEAMLLSPVTDSAEFNDLIYAFAKSITKGTADETPIDRDLLRCFAGCLRWGHHAIPRSEQIFGSILPGLSKHLISSNNQSRLRDSYLLTQTIGTLLDAMVDCKIEGLDRESLHEPLVKKLKDLKDHDESRMAQAARYALQALRRIPDNEGPWEEALRYSGMTFNVIAHISSAVAKFDVQQLIDAGPDAFAVLKFFGDALKGGKEIWDTREDFKQMISGMRNVSERKGWYAALRHAKMFTQLEAFEGLKEFIAPFKGAPPKWCTETDFWCGLYSQLEQQWVSREPSTRDSIEKFIQWTFENPLLRKICKKDNSIHAWVGLLADSMDKPDWKIILPQRKRGVRSGFFRAKEYEPKLKDIAQNSKAEDDKQDSCGDSQLLRAALEKCSEAQVFYADVIMAQHYTRGKLLHVKRLSGDDLPIENCYINLSLMQNQEGGDQKGRNKFSLQDRLQMEAPDTQTEIALEDLFKQRNVRNGSLAKPSRILIRGRAGVGKTTLCKKITYASLYHSLWESQYDRIIWIPLRKLKGYRTFEDFLNREIFKKVPYSTALWEAFQETLRDVQNSRTLFILDGLDEIAGVQQQIEDFQDILNRQNVIITSRPHAVFPSRLKEYDLEIETVGFLNHEIEAYVDKVCNESDGLQIKDFMTQHWVMKGLMRIPIQLDALCFTWEEGIQREKPLTTMTALYEAIEIKLWKKDMPRLDPKTEHKAAKCRLRSQMFRLMPDNIDFVQYIAFLGLYNNVTEFTYRIREDIYHHFPNMTDRILDEISFLRSSDSSSNDHDQDYYFLHLTFQEYFAARHFVQSWQIGGKIETLDLQTGKAISLSTEEFISHEKYNGRYNIMWRFITGALASANDDLVRFFEQIEMKPRDLLGPTHLRFLMHCFSEVSEKEENATLKKFRGNMENQLSQVFFMDDAGSIHLGTEMEFPEHILSRCLEMFDPKQQERASRVINGRLRRHPNFSSQDVISVISDPDEEFARAALHSLLYRLNLPEEILSAIIDNFRIYSAVNVIDQQKELPQPIIGKLIFEYPRTSYRKEFIRALTKSSLSNPSVLNHLVAALDDPDLEVQYESLYALSYHSHLPVPIYHKIASRLEKFDDYDPWAKISVIDILNTQATLSNGIVERIWRMVDDESERVQTAASKTLRQHGHLCADEIARRFANSQDKDSFACAMTSTAFANNSSPSDVILDHCVDILTVSASGPFSSVEIKALRALGKSSSLSSHVLGVILQLIDRQGKTDSVDHIWYIMEYQKVLPDKILNKISSHLLDKGRDNKFDVRIFHSLSSRSWLPDSIIDSLGSFILSQPPSLSTMLIPTQYKMPHRVIEHTTSILLSSNYRRAAEGEKILRRHVDYGSLLPRLESGYWIRLFKSLLFNCKDGDTFCSVQDGYLQISTPEHSWKINIEAPEQRQKMEAALEAIEQWIQDGMGDAWSTLELRSWNRKRYL
ncbi:hypothetical protein PENVUL_c038G00723 [Penicillium vulpinum]|uniref:NACHT domain-containing protein n=1 Tax=Penicillium vulpinum TaxID=29845 RepID=A0A1V6RMM4_9EURO|nr:hypothetical protein PENVUL_c038G00723 [Penicillium vulpinum]